MGVVQDHVGLRAQLSVLKRREFVTGKHAVGDVVSDDAVLDGVVVVAVLKVVVVVMKRRGHDGENSNVAAVSITGENSPIGNSFQTIRWKKTAPM